jgi:hypothetical protein
MGILNPLAQSGKGKSKKIKPGAALFSVVVADPTQGQSHGFRQKALSEKEHQFCERSKKAKHKSSKSG